MVTLTLPARTVPPAGPMFLITMEGPDAARAPLVSSSMSSSEAAPPGAGRHTSDSSDRTP